MKEISLLKRIRIQSGYKEARGAHIDSEHLLGIVAYLLIAYTGAWVWLDQHLVEGANPQLWLNATTISMVIVCIHSELCPAIRSAIAIRKTYLKQVDLLKAICQNGVSNDIEEYIVDHWERMSWLEVFESLKDRGKKNSDAFVKQMYDLDLPYEAEVVLGTIPLFH